LTPERLAQLDREDPPIEDVIAPWEIIGLARAVYSGLRYGLPALAKLLSRQGAREAGKAALKFSPKIERQMARRGWTPAIGGHALPRGDICQIPRYRT